MTNAMIFFFFFFWFCLFICFGFFFLALRMSSDIYSLSPLVARLWQLW